MGKKAKFKKIRRLASQMPLININAVKGEIISGMDAYQDGIKRSRGQKVKPEFKL